MTSIGFDAIALPKLAIRLDLKIYKTMIKIENDKKLFT